MYFLALYIAYIPLVWWLGGRRFSFRWTRAVTAQALVVMAAAVAVDTATRWSDPPGAVLGLTLTLTLTKGTWALMRLSSMAGASGRLSRIARVGERMRRWMKVLW